MTSITNKNNHSLIQIMALAIFVIFAFFLWQGNKGFTLWDEGFLWYGVQRVTLGEVPIRDFMAYDPGRYYVSALLMTLFAQKGIMALRFVSSIIECVGVVLGLILVSKTLKKQDLLYLALISITLSLWMIMNFKAVAYLMSILLIYALTFLAQTPARRQYLLA